MPSSTLSSATQTDQNAPTITSSKPPSDFQLNLYVHVSQEQSVDLHESIRSDSLVRGFSVKASLIAAKSGDNYDGLYEVFSISSPKRSDDQDQEVINSVMSAMASQGRIGQQSDVRKAMVEMDTKWAASMLGRYGSFLVSKIKSNLMEGKFPLFGTDKSLIALCPLQENTYSDISPTGIILVKEPGKIDQGVYFGGAIEPRDLSTQGFSTNPMRVYMESSRLESRLQAKLNELSKVDSSQDRSLSSILNCPLYLYAADKKPILCFDLSPSFSVDEDEQDMMDAKGEHYTVPSGTQTVDFDMGKNGLLRAILNVVQKERLDQKFVFLVDHDDYYCEVECDGKENLIKSVDEISNKMREAAQELAKSQWDDENEQPEPPSPD